MLAHGSSDLLTDLNYALSLSLTQLRMSLDTSLICLMSALLFSYLLMVNLLLTTTETFHSTYPLISPAFVPHKLRSVRKHDGCQPCPGLKLKVSELFLNAPRKKLQILNEAQLAESQYPPRDHSLHPQHQKLKGSLWLKHLMLVRLRVQQKHSHL